MRRLYVIYDTHDRVWAECENKEDAYNQAEEMQENSDWERYKFIYLYLIYDGPDTDISYECEDGEIYFYNHGELIEDTNEDGLVVYAGQLRWSEYGTLKDILDLFNY